MFSESLTNVLVSSALSTLTITSHDWL